MKKFDLAMTSWTSVACSFIAACLLLNFSSADDSFTCCMSGMKQIRSVGLCQAPCCPGYEEIVERPPLLAPVVYCKHNKRYFQQHKKNIRNNIMRYFRGKR